MSKTTPKKEDKEDDSTLRLMYGYRKRCDNFGIAVSPCIKGIFDMVTESGKNPTAKLELVRYLLELAALQWINRAYAGSSLYGSSFRAAIPTPKVTPHLESRNWGLGPPYDL